jgi:hypothetical protein
VTSSLSWCGSHGFAQLSLPPNRRPKVRGPEFNIQGPYASAIASTATSTPGISAPKRTIDRAGFAPGKNSA